MNFIVNESRQVLLVTVLEFELGYQHAFQLFSLLNLLQSLTPSIAHLGAFLRPCCTSYSGHFKFYEKIN